MPLFKFDGPDGPEEHAVEKGPNGLLRWHLAESREIQRVGDMTIKEFQRAIFAWDATALTLLVQLLWKRQGRSVRFEDVDFDLSTYDFDFLPGEEPADEESVAADDAEGDAVDPTEIPSGDEPTAG